MGLNSMRIIFAKSLIGYILNKCVPKRLRNGRWFLSNCFFSICFGRIDAKKWRDFDVRCWIYRFFFLLVSYFCLALIAIPKYSNSPHGFSNGFLTFQYWNDKWRKIRGKVVYFMNKALCIVKLPCRDKSEIYLFVQLIT